WYLRCLIIPLEFLSNFVTRPLTLSLRLFANMVAGHLIIMIFVVGGGFLLTYPSSIIYNVAGGLSLILSFALFALELFVGFLQAYVFTVLSAQYVASSMSEEH
ncbi:MAG: F0F1 ATP synthase subunit A, partial [Cutibacterium acnes]|nr:F0F1 ATP synthase subunit A [Cutibacterium acnes]